MLKCAVERRVFLIPPSDCRFRWQPERFMEVTIGVGKESARFGGFPRTVTQGHGVAPPPFRSPAEPALRRVMARTRMWTVPAAAAECGRTQQVACIGGNLNQVEAAG